jgi:hypothetical protein
MNLLILTPECARGRGTRESRAICNFDRLFGTLRRDFLMSAFEEQTTEKLSFAEFYLNERLKLGNSGEMQERAHEETVLAHLVGAKDSFLQEINEAYRLGLRVNQVSEEKLRRRLREAEKKSPALDQIEKLEKEENSWLGLVIEFRHQGMHRGGIKRGFFKGGSKDGSVEFLDPYTHEPMGLGIQQFLKDAFEKMTALILHLRETLPTGGPPF